MRLSSEQYPPPPYLIFSKPCRTERTYVRCLQELYDIYIIAANESVVSLPGRMFRLTYVSQRDRKLVFGDIEILLAFHKNHFLPALEAAVELQTHSRPKHKHRPSTAGVTVKVARIFLLYTPYMRAYSTYIKCEFSLTHQWLLLTYSARQQLRPCPAAHKCMDPANLREQGHQFYPVPLHAGLRQSSAASYSTIP